MATFKVLSKNFSDQMDFRVTIPNAAIGAAPASHPSSVSLTFHTATPDSAGQYTIVSSILASSSISPSAAAAGEDALVTLSFTRSGNVYTFASGSNGLSIGAGQDNTFTVADGASLIAIAGMMYHSDQVLEDMECLFSRNDLPAAADIGDLSGFRTGENYVEVALPTPPATADAVSLQKAKVQWTDLQTKKHEFAEVSFDNTANPKWAVLSSSTANTATDVSIVGDNTVKIQPADNLAYQSTVTVRADAYFSSEVLYAGAPGPDHTASPQGSTSSIRYDGERGTETMVDLGTAPVSVAGGLVSSGASDLSSSTFRFNMTASLAAVDSTQEATEVAANANILLIGASDVAGLHAAIATAFPDLSSTGQYLTTAGTDLPSTASGAFLGSLNAGAAGANTAEMEFSVTNDRLHAQNGNQYGEMQMAALVAIKQPSNKFAIYTNYGQAGAAGSTSVVYGSANLWNEAGVTNQSSVALAAIGLSAAGNIQLEITATSSTSDPAVSGLTQTSEIFTSGAATFTYTVAGSNPATQANGNTIPPAGAAAITGAASPGLATNVDTGVNVNATSGGVTIPNINSERQFAVITSGDQFAGPAAFGAAGGLATSPVYTAGEQVFAGLPALAPTSSAVAAADGNGNVFAYVAYRIGNETKDSGFVPGLGGLVSLNLQSLTAGGVAGPSQEMVTGGYNIDQDGVLAALPEALQNAPYTFKEMDATVLPDLVGGVQQQAAYLLTRVLLTNNANVEYKQSAYLSQAGSGGAGNSLGSAQNIGSNGAPQAPANNPDQGVKYVTMPTPPVDTYGATAAANGVYTTYAALGYGTNNGLKLTVGWTQNNNVVGAQAALALATVAGLQDGLQGADWTAGATLWGVQDNGAASVNDSGLIAGVTGAHTLYFRKAKMIDGAAATTADGATAAEEAEGYVYSKATGVNLQNVARSDMPVTGNGGIIASVIGNDSTRPDKIFVSINGAGDGDGEGTITRSAFANQEKILVGVVSDEALLSAPWSGAYSGNAFDMDALAAALINATNDGVHDSAKSFTVSSVKAQNQQVSPVVLHAPAVAGTYKVYALRYIPSGQYKNSEYEPDFKPAALAATPKTAGNTRVTRLLVNLLNGDAQTLAQIATALSMSNVISTSPPNSVQISHGAHNTVYSTVNWTNGGGNLPLAKIVFLVTFQTGTNTATTAGAPSIPDATTLEGVMAVFCWDSANNEWELMDDGMQAIGGADKELVEVVTAAILANLDGAPAAALAHKNDAGGSGQIAVKPHATNAAGMTIKDMVCLLIDSYGNMTMSGLATND